MFRKTTSTTIATYAVLALAGATPLVMPEQLTMPSASGAAGEPTASTIVLDGTVRDFNEWNVASGHIEFDQNAPSSWISCSAPIHCGNVSTTLGEDGKPVGLMNGEKYALGFFFAARNRAASSLRIVTNLDPKSAAVPEVTASFD